MQERTDFYTYTLLRPIKPGNEEKYGGIFIEGYVPFYIGKGCKKRIYMHRACANKERMCRHHSCRIIRKELREGRDIIEHKIAEDLLEESAFRLEKLMISCGRVYNWPLVNLTNGGDGTSGFRTKRTPEQNEVNRRRSQERFSKEEERKKMSDAAIRRFSNPEEREKQQARALKRFASPIFRKMHRERMKKVHGNREISKEERDRRISGAKEFWSRPGQKERQSIANKKRYENPEEIEKAKERTEKLWKDPDYANKLLEIRKDPEYRQRLSESASKRGANHFNTYTFLDPNKNIVVVENLRSFCRENNLSYPSMWLVQKETQEHHQEWRKYPKVHFEHIKKEDKTTSKRLRENPLRAKMYPGFIEPDGVTVHKDVFNLKNFCLEHDLQLSKMCYVASGKIKTHKGWTVYQPESQPE